MQTCMQNARMSCKRLQTRIQARANTHGKCIQSHANTQQMQGTQKVSACKHAWKSKPRTSTCKQACNAHTSICKRMQITHTSACNYACKSHTSYKRTIASKSRHKRMQTHPTATRLQASVYKQAHTKAHTSARKSATRARMQKRNICGPNLHPRKKKKTSLFAPLLTAPPLHATHSNPNTDKIISLYRPAGEYRLSR